MIRPAVVIRKNSQSNRSEKGAMTQAVLMSIFRTLKLRGPTGLAAGGPDPVDTIAAALRTYAATARLISPKSGRLPTLSVQSVADG